MNTQAKILPFRVNILSLYKEACSKLKALEAERSALKSQIYTLMDQNQTDSLSLGDCKATRSLVVQERLDSKAAKKLLGDKVQEVLVETPVIRLQVI